MKNTLSMRCKSFAGLLLAVGFSTSLIVPVAHANLILNGSFESPVVTANSFTANTLPTSWTKAGALNPGIFNGTVSTYPSPQNGNQFVDIGSSGINAAISQGFTVATAGSYLLTWFDNTQISGGSSYKVELLDSSSVVIATASYSFTGASSWNSRSLSWTPGVGSYTLKFTPTGSAETLLDNVSLDAVGVVPEASTITAGALLLLPLGASTLRILRKKQAA